MDYNKNEKEDYGKMGAEAEIAVDAVPDATASGPPIRPGHPRLYCKKSHAPYDLTQGATSWR